MNVNADASVTATFNKDVTHQVSISGTATAYFSTIQDAYNAANSDDVLMLWAISYTEHLNCNRPMAITLQGGYNGGYTSITGEVDLNGSLTITDGTVVVDGVSVR